MLSSCVKPSKIKSILSTAVVESNYVTAETMGQTLGLEQLHHHKIKSDKKHHKDKKEKEGKRKDRQEFYLHLLWKFSDDSLCQMSLSWTEPGRYPC